MREVKKDGEVSADFLNCFVLNAETEKRAKQKFDKIMKKHGKRSGSGYTINVEQLLKILEKGEENDRK